MHAWACVCICNYACNPMHVSKQTVRFNNNYVACLSTAGHRTDPPVKRFLILPQVIVTPNPNWWFPKWWQEGWGVWGVHACRPQTMACQLSQHPIVDAYHNPLFVPIASHISDSLSGQPEVSPSGSFDHFQSVAHVKTWNVTVDCTPPGVSLSYQRTRYLF